jgi:two-component system, NtrC family, response regulator HydG
MTAKTHRILIVDDDLDNASSLCELFEFEGHQVTVVHSGDQAIAAYLNNDYDVAFMDVMMPGKNGVESFLEIKRLKPSARVVMMTGFSVEQLLCQAMENGAMGVLTKPMETSRVLGMLDEVGPGGVVVAEAGHSGEHMHRLLSQSGRPCRLIREARGLNQDTLPDESGVLIFELNRPLIESFGYYRQMRQGGCEASAVIMLDANTPASASTEMLRDFALTGVLNKPFDPLLLLEKLDVIAA